MLRIPELVFRENPPLHVPDILSWIGHNPEQFESLMGKFGLTVYEFNAIGPTQMDSTNENFHIVKKELDGKPLPLPAELMNAGDVGSALRYKSVLKKIKTRMYEGQKPEKKRTQEPLMYHTTNTETMNLVVASIFHTYEEVAKASPGLKDKKLEEDRIIEALMEVAARHKGSTLFNSLASKSGMNWVDKYPRFSKEFRVRNGFE